MMQMLLFIHCFPDKYKIPLFTASAKKLNDFLFGHESTIVVPHFIISEIERKGYYNVIDDYFKDLRPSSRFQLMIKLRHNFANLKKHKNFSQEYYLPSEMPICSIRLIMLQIFTMGYFIIVIKLINVHLTLR